MASSVPRDHVLRGLSEERDPREEVDLKHGPKFGIGHLVHGSFEPVPRIGKDDVEAAELLLRERREPLRETRLTDIGHHDERTTTPTPDLRCDRLKPLGSTRCEEQIHPCVRHRERRGCADAAGCTGDNGDFPSVTRGHPHYRNTPRRTATVSWLAMSLILLLVSVFGALVPQDAPSTRALRVGVTHRLPYSWKDANGAWSGPAIDLWKQVATTAKLDYELVARAEDDFAPRLRDGTLDVAACGVPISAELHKSIDFSVPFDSGGYSVVVHRRNAAQPLSILRRLMTFDVLIWVTFIGAATVGAGIVIRLVEGRRNVEHFGRKSHPINGFWWAITTLSTVGYGDLVPRTGVGKAVAAAWMLLSLVLVTLFTSSVVATITVGRLAPILLTISDLDPNQIGIVDRLSSRAAARHLGILPKAFPTVDDAFGALADGRVEAVLHPTNELRASVAARRDPQLQVLPKEALRGFIGFGLSKALSAALEDRINAAILDATESPAWVTVSQQLDHPPEDP